MRRSCGYLIGLAVIGLPSGCGPAQPSPTSSPASTQATVTTLSSAASEPEIPDPTSDAPVTAAAWIIRGPDARGGDMELHVRARVAPGHYLHSTDAEAPFTPTSVELVPANWITPVAEWELLTKPDARGRLIDVLEFRRRLRLSEAAKPGLHEVECALKYQACTDELCWPPRVLKLQAPLVLKAAGG